MKNVTLMPTDWCWYVEEEKSLCKTPPARRSDPRSCCSGRLLKE